MAQTATTTAPAAESSRLSKLLQEAAANGSSLADLTPEKLFDLDRETVERLRSSEPSAGITPAMIEAWNRNGYQVTMARSEQAALIRRRGGQRAVSQRVADALGVIGQDLGRIIIWEESRNRTNSPVQENLGTGILHLVVAAPRDLTTRKRIGRRLVNYADPETTEPTNAVVRVRDIPVATISDTGDYVQLYAHPWLTKGGTLTTTDRASRSTLATTLITAINNASGATLSNGQQGDWSETELRDAIGTLDLLPGFVSVFKTSTSKRRRELTDNLNLVMKQAEKTRVSLMNHLRQKRQLEQERQALEQAAGLISMESLTRALTEIERMRTRLRPVRSVSFVATSNKPVIRIQLHPLVISGSGRRVLLDNLVFTLPLTHNSCDVQPKWEGCNGTMSPHPHVKGGGHTCWGEAEKPLYDAMQRRDYAAAVMLITSWATIYNDASPHIRICNFPRTTLQSGWHPELPVASERRG